MEISYSEARRSLAELLERAAQGERITITRWGKPVAELGPAAARPTLDLTRLRTVRARVGNTKLLGETEIGDTKGENGVLLAREGERY